MVNEILLRRKNHVYVEGQAAPENAASEERRRFRVLTMMKNMEGLGFVFSQDLFEQLSGMEEQAADTCYLELTGLLKERLGADREYHPMYPNFPEEVMEKSDGELYWNALVHYWSGGRLYPSIQKRERLPLFDESRAAVLSPGTREELLQVFRDLASANGSLSGQDLQDIQWFFTHMPEVVRELPETIPYKENAAHIGACLIRYSALAEASALQNYFRTGTDVLRLAAALSDGDISLRKNVRFRSFSRKERKLLMELLAECSGLLEAMQQRKEVWKRLGERLHPGEYRAERYARVRHGFEKIRAGRPVGHFAGRVEAAFQRRDVRAALKLLKERPGELARHLDRLLRAEVPAQPPECPLGTERAGAGVPAQPRWLDTRLQRLQFQKEVLEAFEETADQVSTPVLLQVRTHFQYRTHQSLRCYFPKGKFAEARRIEPAAGQVEEEICARAVTVCEQALIRRFAQLAPMGKVWLAEELKDYRVPFAMRSASKAVRTLVRGSRLRLDRQAKAVRGFVWWTNRENGGRVDLDLSAAVFDKNWNYLEHVSYTNLKSDRYRACHSGDIVDGGPADGAGVCEFLDVDLDSVLQYGGRYVVYQVYSYTRQCFSSLPNASFGYMEREDVKSGEIFEPRTVRQRMDLVQESNVTIPMILDCASRQMVWCDISLNLSACRRHLGGNNLESNLSGVALACCAMVNMRRTSLYDLLKLHVAGRGELCGSKEEADMVFDVEEGITPFDTEILLAEYM